MRLSDKPRATLLGIMLIQPSDLSYNAQHFFHESTRIIKRGYKPDSIIARMPSSEHIKTGGIFPDSPWPPCSAGSNLTSQTSPSAIVEDPPLPPFPARVQSSFCRLRSHASTVPPDPPTFTKMP
jgi:hypothetical protein